MKKFNEFINERLKLNKDSKLFSYSIKDAKKGDIITTYYRNDKNHLLIFIFDKFEDTQSYGKLVRYIGYYDSEKDIYYNNGSIASMGFVDDYDKKDYHLSSNEERQMLFKGIKKAGYEWDEKTKNVKRL